MMPTRTIQTLSFTVLFLVGVVCLAVPPKIEKAVPDNGDAGVDPSLKEMKFTFDQDMQSGMSVVGGGEKFPEISGKPRWSKSRTLVVPVKLRPNHEYSLSINSDKFQNFKNAAGEPATPYPIRFRTGTSGKKGVNAIPADNPESITTENRLSLESLRTAIRDHYSYRDRMKIDWDALLQKNEASLSAAKTPTEFAQIAGTMLAIAQDKHVWFQVGEETIPSYVRPITPNANFALLPKLVPGWQMHGRRVASGLWDDGIGYVAITTWEDGKLDGGKDLFAALDRVKDAKALVIDVRGNGGGAEPLAQQVAGCFVGERCLYGKHVTRDPQSPGGFKSPSERWLDPNTNGPHLRCPVAVLSGPVVMSSCESFLLMMKQAPNTILVGATSQGCSGNPKPHDLGNGVTIFLPSWKDMAPDGRELEGVGIAPDIEVKTKLEDFSTTDPVLSAALIHLRAR